MVVQATEQEIWKFKQELREWITEFGDTYLMSYGRPLSTSLVMIWANELEAEAWNSDHIWSLESPVIVIFHKSE